MKYYNIAVTGASSHLGGLLLQRLHQTHACSNILALDSRDGALANSLDGVEYVKASVLNKNIHQLFKKHNIQAVAHLDTVMVPPSTREEIAKAKTLDIEGTKNMLECCLKARVKHIVIGSSAGAYGYHFKGSDAIKENQPLRGHPSIAHASHKATIELLLNESRKKYPQLTQTIFRMATILGDGINSPITEFLKDEKLIGLMGEDTNFSFIWDEDVVEAFKIALFEGKPGIFNLSGEGMIAMSDISSSLKKPVQFMPKSVISLGIKLGKMFGLTYHNPDFIDYLYGQPVLETSKLKDHFGFAPQKSSIQAFTDWAQREGLLD
ncbi:MAG: NAD-dependent epimerase/dehydratase family protein [Alphaproteobacteria bacterium]